MVIACYLPPGYEKKHGEAAVEFLVDTVSAMKRRFQNPYIVLAGDFNQWKGEEAVADHADFKEVPVGLTRGSRSIDRVFLNFERSVCKAGTQGRRLQEERL